MNVPDAARPAARRFAQFVRGARAHGRGVRAYLAGPAPRGRATVWYGLTQTPQATDHAVGGIVKLQHLISAFPDDARHFNILYLVSSRLPDGAEALTRWAKRKGARIVLNQNGVAYPGWHGPGWEKVNTPICAVLAVADHVFYQSEFCRMSADKFARRPRGAAEVLYNPVDTSRFAPAGVPRDGKHLTLLLGESQDQWYRLESALRTLAALVQRGINASLIVTGRLHWHADAVSARRDADSLCASLGVSERVTFVGPYTQQDAPAVFQGADILLHTKYNDPCPTVVLEALSCGLPVVYSASGGVPELVGEAGAGIPAELSWDRDIPPDPARLADAVCAVRADRPALAAAARARAVARFDVGLWTARHRAVFGSLVSA